MTYYNSSTPFSSSDYELIFIIPFDKINENKKITYIKVGVIVASAGNL